MRFFQICVLSLTVVGCTVAPEKAGFDDVNHFAADKLKRVTSNQEPITRPIDLYEAMARALKYNLDTKVELKEKALKIRTLDLANYKLLPDFVSNSGYAGRSNYSGGHSQLLTGKKNKFFQTKKDLGLENVSNSTSQERNVFSQDITFTWHILDFGLSYVRAKQTANQVLIAEQVKRKVVNATIEAVRSAYWRAISSQRLLSKLRWLEGKVQRALRETRGLYKLGKTSPIAALTFERELVSIKQEIQKLQGELSNARYQLAALMNIPPNAKYRLAQPRRSLRGLRLKIPAKSMVGVALRNRPEIIELLYKNRINEEEANAALLELLPGLQLYGGLNIDSNDFLFNNHWLSWGAKASWNLIRLFQYPARKNVINGEESLLDARALSVTMAIMLEVHVSRAKYYHARRQFRTSSEYLNVQRRLLRQIRVEAKVNRVSEQTRLREEMNTLVAEVKRDIAYASVQNAYANVFASLGLDPHWSSFDENASVRSLAASLKRLWIERGDNKTGMRIARQN
jgi:outer membrane protein TolC